MQIAKITDIIIKPNRQRKEFDAQALADLAQSIQSQQLLHAPVVREENGSLVLVAGESRLKACIDVQMLGGTVRFNNEPVPDGFVPYVTMGQLSEIEAEEAELSENIKRQDLTWQENASARARLHALRSKQAQAEGRIHTVSDTAMEVTGRSDGAYRESIRKDIILAPHLSNPAIAKAKDANEAFKILKRQEVAQKNVQLAQHIGKTFSNEDHRLFNVDCLAWMANYSGPGFDVICTDPPYGMGADTFGDGGGGRLANNEHHYKDDYDSWLRLMTAWCPLSFRVTKPEAHAYVFCDLDNFHKLKDLMRNAGWYVFRTPFICTKPNSGRVPLPDEGPRRQWEMLLYAIKGHKRTTAIYPDVITTTADAGLGHGAQKPVALFSDLLRRSCKSGDMVLDTFAGSGTIFAAAHSLKVLATGCEMNPEYYSIAYQRIQNLMSPEQVLIQNSLGDELKQLMAA